MAQNDCACAEQWAIKAARSGKSVAEVLAIQIVVRDREIARLGALLTEAADILRLIAREEFDDPMPGFDQCPYCYQRVHGGEFGMWIDHDADCPVERARNFGFPLPTPDAKDAPATPGRPQGMRVPSDVRGREGE